MQKPGEEQRQVCLTAERHAMDCERVQELIAPFVNGKLNTEETGEFLRHIENCAECKEELEVSYSLMTAMKQLDEDTDLSDNYIRDLNEKIENCVMDGLRKKRDCARRRVVLGALVTGLLFTTGSMASEKRCEQEEMLLRTVWYGEENEDDAISEEQPEVFVTPVPEQKAEEITEKSGPEDKEEKKEGVLEP